MFEQFVSYEETRLLTHWHIGPQILANMPLGKNLWANVSFGKNLWTNMPLGKKSRFLVGNELFKHYVIL